MSNFNLDLISKGLPKKVAQMETQLPFGTFYQDVLFGLGDVFGNDKSNLVEFDWRKGSQIQLPEESIRGEEATRVNYKTGFNAKVVEPNYYNEKDEVTIDDADARVFGEEISAENATQQRVAQVFAEKAYELQKAGRLAKEVMCRSAIFDGKVVNKSGEQAFPMKASLLNLNGATLFSDPLKTLADAYKAIRASNKAFVLDSILMNPDDALNFVAAAKEKGIFETDNLNLGKMTLNKEYPGVAEVGYIRGVGTNVYIYTYADTDHLDTPFVPRGKALLFNKSRKVGKMAYGRLKAAEGVAHPHFIVAKERMIAFKEGSGDDARTVLQYQTSPLPLVTNIDGFGVLASIPASV